MGEEKIGEPVAEPGVGGGGVGPAGGSRSDSTVTGRWGCVVRFVPRLAGSMACGILTAMAFPPFSRPELAWFSLVPMLLSLMGGSVRSGALVGFVAGCTFWLISLSWLLRLGVTGCPVGLAVLAWLLLSVCCAGYWAAFGAVSARLAGYAASGRVWAGRARFFLLIPLLWTGFEFLRARLFSGFAWNQMGVSLYGSTALIQIATLGGVYAMTWAILMTNAAIAVTLYGYWTWIRGKTRSVVGWELFVACGIVAGMAVGGNRAIQAERQTAARMPVLRIAAVQPNVPQDKKWSEGEEAALYEALRVQTDFVLAAREQLDLIVWPETALPQPIQWDPVAYGFARGVATNGVPLLFGALEVERNGMEPLCYNSAFLMDSQGELAGVYRKRHLVPFGEYVPFDKVFPVLRRLVPLGYTCWPGTEATVLEVGSGALGILICFEDTVAELARDSVRAGARLLVNLTNDAWFDGSAGAVQHMAHCVFRCVENRTPAVRCANTGVTCFIDSTGLIEGREVLAAADWGLCRDGFRMSQVALRDAGRTTVYGRYGDWTLGGPCGVGAGLAFLLVAGLPCVQNLLFRIRNRRNSA